MITAHSDSTHVTEHRMCFREDSAFFKYWTYDLLACMQNTVQVRLVSLGLCNNYAEVLLPLSIESVDLFQGRDTFFFVVEFTSSNSSICREWQAAWTGSLYVGRGCFLFTSFNLSKIWLHIKCSKSWDFILIHSLKNLNLYKTSKGDGIKVPLKYVVKRGDKNFYSSGRQVFFVC